MGPAVRGARQHAAARRRLHPVTLRLEGGRSGLEQHGVSIIQLCPQRSDWAAGYFNARDQPDGCELRTAQGSLPLDLAGSYFR